MAIINETSGYVNVFLSSNVSTFTSQKRFPLSTTIAELKGKLELITGANSSTMQLQLLDRQRKLIQSLDDDTTSLEACHVHNDMIIHVIDSDPSKSLGEFEDLSKVEKYEMPEEEYAKRGESLRAFKEKMKLGRFAERDPESKLKEEEEATKAISIGARCEVTTPKAPPRRGVVMFVGKTHFKEGYWIGVKCDEPLGKNDGSVDGQRYFDCPPKYGLFVKPNSVKVGDYPEETLSDDEEM
ncbi:tubulin-folding cofactor B-like [Gigantopelta aegis]|uniref:tubulin-folding cofactor B-like n=1 Tax=Gigantopelta aegis TaxID=1735272 RepID=UPI001B88A1DF|nr:tubulin-folding cofactor B-like [Gigantopelta aegis]